MRLPFLPGPSAWGKKPSIKFSIIEKQTDICREKAVSESGAVGKSSWPPRRLKVQFSKES